jgi:hypothetical protein
LAIEEEFTLLAQAYDPLEEGFYPSAKDKSLAEKAREALPTGKNASREASKPSTECNSPPREDIFLPREDIFLLRDDVFPPREGVWLPREAWSLLPCHAVRN